jgi:hypothetical protein
MLLLVIPARLDAQSVAVSSLSEINATRDTVFLVDTRTLDRRPLYVFTEPQYIRDASIQLSPKGDLVALLPIVSTFIQDSRGAYYQERKLLIVDTAGHTVHELLNVQKFAWSPHGTEIACITGRDYEGFSFAPWELMVVSTADWKQRILDRTIGHQDIAWPRFDSMIYTTDFGTVYRIDPKTGVIARTDHVGIYFSSDGSYYFSPNYEGAGFRIYERATNKDITPERHKGNPAVNFHQWLPDGNTLIFGDVFREKYVFDVGTRTMRATISGQVLAYDTRTKEFIVLKHNTYFPEVPAKRIERVPNR